MLAHGPQGDRHSAVAMTHDAFGEPMPNLAIYLEEIKYFLDDMYGGHWQSVRLLLKRAADASEDLVLEMPQSQTSQDIGEAIESMKVIISRGKCPRFVIIEAPSQLQRDLIYSVERLRFMCKGTATVFPYPSLTDNFKQKLRSEKLSASDMLEVLSPYYDFVAEREPQWVCAEKFARCAIIVMVFSKGQDDFVWHVWDAENEGGQWAFPGGDVNRVFDVDLCGTAEREWNEEVLGFDFNVARDNSIEPIVLPFLASKSARYPVQPYIYVKATPEFFEATQSSQVERFRFSLPPNAVLKSRNMQVEDFRRFHTDPSVAFVEHEWGAWAKIEMDGSQFIPPIHGDGECGPRGTKVRWENVAALQQHWPEFALPLLGRSHALGQVKGKGSGGKAKALGKRSLHPMQVGGQGVQACGKGAGKASKAWPIVRTGGGAEPKSRIAHIKNWHLKPHG
ncbi:unnamed protein product [Symbiodinium natans]|uniref:Uncharacterized protein n=1 Tax=Symbiodinium natans TaxID=878477 RepID=A0A812QH48_9DINO|nr:unnamed protein product [Symbiodinium natans]